MDRSTFSGKIAFVLVAAGSAVGLGNIWRFPYLAAKYGGGIFLLIYIVIAVLFGVSLMITEIAIGRKTGKSPLDAFLSLDKRFAWVGLGGTLIPAIILPYYSVIGGWVLKYLGVFVSGGAAQAAQASYFNDYISSPWQPLMWFLVFLTLTYLMVLAGVEKGIEVASKLMMPALLLLTLVLAIYSVTRPGAGPGIAYYLKPDFSRFSVTTVLAALGQVFFSCSLAMGIMITYGSYMKKDINIETSGIQIVAFDTTFAIIAGLIVVPSVYVFSGGDQSAMGAGPGLMFITLPRVFHAMTGGTAVGSVFFLLVLFAALTSSISLMEAVASVLQDRKGWSRTKATTVIFAVSILIGSLSSLGFGWLSFIQWNGMGILDLLDFFSNSVLMPLIALGTCLAVGYFIGTKTIAQEIKLSSRFRLEKLHRIVIRYIGPIGIVVVLVTEIMKGLGLLAI